MDERSGEKICQSPLAYYTAAPMGGFVQWLSVWFLASWAIVNRRNLPCLSPSQKTGPIMPNMCPLHSWKRCDVTFNLLIRAGLRLLASLPEVQILILETGLDLPCFQNHQNLCLLLSKSLIMRSKLSKSCNPFAGAWRLPRGRSWRHWQPTPTSWRVGVLLGLHTPKYTSSSKEIQYQIHPMTKNS